MRAIEVGGSGVGFEGDEALDVTEMRPVFSLLLSWLL